MVTIQRKSVLASFTTALKFLLGLHVSPTLLDKTMTKVGSYRLWLNASLCIAGQPGESAYSKAECGVLGMAFYLSTCQQAQSLQSRNTTLYEAELNPLKRNQLWATFNRFFFTVSSFSRS